MFTIGIAKQCDPTLASTRFRFLIPSRNIDGFEYKLGRGDITICPKFSVRISEAKAMRDDTVLLWDVCDDHFDTEKVGDYYRQMARVAHVVTCTTDVLRDRIYKETGVEAFVISDPLEFERKEPRVTDPQKLLWHGHKINLPPLLELDLNDYDVMVISNLDEEWVLPWSEKNVQMGLEWCDAMIIPVEKGIAHRVAKSPNRMTEAINAGRFVIANDIPSYKDYGMWLGDIHEGLNWLKHNQQEALRRLKAAQRIVQERHHPKVIAQDWAKLFDYILARAGVTGMASST